MSRTPSPHLDRRDFIKASTLLTGSALTGLPAMAGPFKDSNEYLRLIPVDKKLSPAWVASLFERGAKETYTQAADLDHIGMPVGGLCAGTVYLSGDGRLWLWDIFNRDQEGIQPRTVTYRGGKVRTRDGANYIEGAQPEAPFDIGFTIRAAGKDYALSRQGFSQVRFRGEYPQARISYRQPGLPLEVELEAFSPFIPLNVDDSSLPLTVMQVSLRNSGDHPLPVGVRGHLQNPVCLETGGAPGALRRNAVVSGVGWTGILCSAESGSPSGHARPDVVFERFEHTTYEGWEVEGTAFGKGPVTQSGIADYQGNLNGEGGMVNSHASAPGKSIEEKDSQQGSLTSRPFPIERRFIRLRIGGGRHAGRTCVNLLMDGKTVASITGRSQNRMDVEMIDVQSWAGREARLQIVDAESGGWGNIGVDEIVFTDQRPQDRPLEQQRDFGTMALALLGQGQADADRTQADPVTEMQAAIDAPLTGTLGREETLAPGQTSTWTFLVAWHFPNFYARGLGQARVGHHYAHRFPSARAVVDYMAGHADRLISGTRRWTETWYDSTLPYWLLDRTMANTSTLATTTCYRFEDGRFWAWEGIGCCPGTCTHVWHYAQAPGRLFPELERITRERVDFGLALHGDGGIGMRAGQHQANEAAHDGQCGRILGAYREHQMSTDDTFLQRIWPGVKRAVQFLIDRDANEDGLIEGAQPNTLDAAWYGKISFLASLYLAALQAGAAMADEMNNPSFATTCRTLADRGKERILELFNGEYFFQEEDPKRKKDIGVGPGCYIDQILGQSWAHQVDLGRLFDKDKQHRALQALWTYNFVPDVGPFRDQFTRGRWYAMAGDAGLLMCTWPRGGQNPAFKDHWQYMYFNECMSGFEWQVASHMIAEGMLREGLAISRAIHDRYRAQLRNPYNEIECSDHYARAMASYGVFITTCGFTSHGPKEEIGFAPRLKPEDFRAAFTAAGSWGQFRQRRQGDTLTAEIEVRWGRLHLKQIRLAASRAGQVAVTLNDRALPASVSSREGTARITLADAVEVEVDGVLQVVLK